MIIYLGLGVLLLVLGLWLLRLFVEADPAQLARGAGTFLLALGGAASIVLIVLGLASERAVLVSLGGAGLSGLWFIVRHRRRQAAPSQGKVSEIETPYLRMRLEHDSGTMSGTVRRGRFQGRHLGELSRDELIELWRECRAEDAQAASLLETYLDRLQPGWRAAGDQAGAAARKAGDAMTREEAYAILGLEPGAAETEIREAYHRLMMKIHPDQGGSTYLAAKLNRAREVLLRG